MRYLIPLLLIPVSIFGKPQTPPLELKRVNGITFEIVHDQIKHIAGTRVYLGQPSDQVPSWNSALIKTSKGTSLDKAIQIAIANPEITHFSMITFSKNESATITINDIKTGQFRGCVNVHGKTTYFFSGKPGFEEVCNKGKPLGYSYTVKRDNS